MQVALEVRSPFLDHRVVELANGLPEESLMAGGVGKRVLREAFRAELPQRVFGRGKQGFGVPIGAWFRGSLRAAVTELLLREGSFARQHLRSAVVERLLMEHQMGQRDHTHRLFALVMLEIFWREFSPSLEA
jgi:asparagine synthase (glutamine-hydrolysing)